MQDVDRAGSAMSSLSQMSEDMSVRSSQSVISIAAEIDQGFELSLNGMDLKNLAFLTKFMTQFK